MSILTITAIKKVYHTGTEDLEVLKKIDLKPDEKKKFKFKIIVKEL